MNIRKLLFFLILFFSVHVYSQTLDPDYSPNHQWGTGHSVPLQACMSYSSCQSPNLQGSNVRTRYVAPHTDSRECIYDHWYGGVHTCGWVNRTPVSSPLPPVYIDVPNNCPTSGTSAGFIAGNSVGTQGSISGCKVTPVFTDVVCDDGITLACKQITGYEYTGEQIQSTDDLPVFNENEIIEEINQNSIGVKPAETSVNVERDTVTMPDGTTIETETTVTNEVRGVGTDRVENEQVTVVQMSNGITKTETTVQTTITNPDGSKTVQTEKITTYTNNGVETFTVQKPLGPITSTATTPVSSSTTNTTINNYGSDGKLTSSESSSSSTGDQLGGGTGGDCEGSDCGEGVSGPNYDESGSWWESRYPEGLQGIINEHREALLQSSGIAQMTDAGISSGGSFPIWTMPSWSIGPLSISAKTLDIDSRVFPFMKAALLFIAAVVCRRLVFGG